MAIFVAPLHLIFVMGLMIPSLLVISREDTQSLASYQPLDTAIQEMERANYFGFIMLLNMAPPNKIPKNITFLMPNNRMLGRAIILPNGVLDFVLQHSIPTPMGFEYLKLLPTGSSIPSSEPNFMLKVSNHGRSSFFLNNAKLISPDICTAEYSIRCHGINGLLLPTNQTLPSPTTPLPTPSPSSSLIPPSSLPAPSPSPSPRPIPPSSVASPPSEGDNYGFAPAAAPQPSDSDLRPRNSGPPCVAFSGILLGVGVQWVVLSIL